MTGTTAHDAALGDLEQTAAALDAGVTSMYPSAAMQVIDRWEQQCRSAADESLTPVADGLVVLRDALSQNRLDGRVIGRALLDLADATSVATQRAEDARIVPKLEHIVAGLRRAGTALGGEQA